MTIPVMSSRFFMCPSSADGARPSVRPAPVSARACMWIERTHRLRAPDAHDAVTHHGCQRDAGREERSNQKGRAGVPGSRQEPADKGQRTDRHSGCLPSRPRCSHEPSRAEQGERPFTDRDGPFVTMLEREAKACRSEERVYERSGSKRYLCLALHSSSL
jgi:hypothetical protein